MEKFYIAEEGSRLRKDYLEYLESAEKVRKLVIKFFETHGIKAKDFYANNSYLHIVPTEEDRKKFGNQLCKSKDKLYRFKANSKINKAWAETLKQYDIEIVPRPYVAFYFDTCWGGRISSRLFEIDGVVYCSFEAEYDFKPKDKLTEIKASEFFKVIEDYNERIKEEGY